MFYNTVVALVVLRLESWDSVELFFLLCSVVVCVGQSSYRILK